MELRQIITKYKEAFMNKYGNRLLPTHKSALEAILRCRTPEAGTVHWCCTECKQQHWKPLSCGNRNCPKCQNHEATQWLERQQAKLLPVEYFMVTFTLPYELRRLAWNNQKAVYSLLFSSAVSTLKSFGLNPDKLGAEIGMTAVLHTHSRELNYHPHLHLIVPGGGINQSRRQWKKLKGKYLFNEFALAKVFRARFLEGLSEAKISIPTGITEKWVVNCKHVGKGLPALKYLSRYLYRGVISEKNIISDKDGKITFSYTESSSGETKYRSLNAQDFLWLILQHVLPKGFRRARDYGFLHGNAKKVLSLVQLVLRVGIRAFTHRVRPVFRCPNCQSLMRVLGICRPTGWSFS